MNIQKAIENLEELVSMLDGYYQNMQKESSTTQEEMEKQLEKISGVLGKSDQIIGDIRLFIQNNFLELTEEQKQKIIDKLKSIQTIALKYRTLKQSISNEIERLRSSKEYQPEGKRQYRIMTADEYEREVKKYIESINIDEIDTIYELQYIFDVLDNIYPKDLKINSNRSWHIMPDYTFCVVDGDISALSPLILDLKTKITQMIKGYKKQQKTDRITQKELEEFISSFIEKIRKKNIQCPYDYKTILDAIDECKKTIESVFFSAARDNNSIGYTDDSRIKFETKVEVTNLDRLKELKQKIDQISKEVKERMLLNYKKNGRKITDKEIEEFVHEQKELEAKFNSETELFSKKIIMNQIYKYIWTISTLGLCWNSKVRNNIAIEYANCYTDMPLYIANSGKPGFDALNQYIFPLGSIKEIRKKITQEELENMINSYLNDINPNTFNNLHKCMFEQDAILDYLNYLKQIQETSKEDSSGKGLLDIVIDNGYKFHCFYYVKITDQKRLQRLIEALERKSQELDERIIDICIKKAQEEDSHFANKESSGVSKDDLPVPQDTESEGFGGRSGR